MNFNKIMTLLEKKEYLENNKNIIIENINNDIIIKNWFSRNSLLDEKSFNSIIKKMYGNQKLYEKAISYNFNNVSNIKYNNYLILLSKVISLYNTNEYNSQLELFPLRGFINFIKNEFFNKNYTNIKLNNNLINKNAHMKNLYTCH